MVLAPDEGSETTLRLEMSSYIEITAFLSWGFFSSAKHTNTSPILGFHTSVDMIFTNNTQYCDKEAPVAAIFYTEPSKNGSRERSNFAQEDSKEVHIASKISKGKIWNAQKVHKFLERYIAYNYFNASFS